MRAQQNRKPKELTAKQTRFTILRARGYTKSAAYREAYNAVRMKPHTVAEEARRLCENPLISRTIAEHLKEARAQDIITTGQVLQGIIDDLEMAREEKNLTAVAALDRVLCQTLGMMRDTLVLSAEKSETDDELVARLSGGDEHKAKMLRTIIGKDTFETDDEKDD